MIEHRTRSLAVVRHSPEAPRPLQRSTRLAIGAALLASAFYFVFLLTPGYRGELWLWLVVVAAEGLTIFQAVGTWWTILAHDDRPEPPDVFAWRTRLLAGEPVPTIDVFVTTCGEELDVIAATVRSARDMQLAHHTWVLDDGRSAELREWCRHEGVGYLRREDRRNAKAGNVNAALRRTSGEYVVLFDADHIPSRRFLVEVLPHMIDPKVAFVQAPQTYRNRHKFLALGTSEAQRLFYELICPGKNHFNSAFCVGTNVMFRRFALELVGGLYEGSNSEDIWTSLLLHGQGWRSVYVPTVLARGLAPETVTAYFSQQFRWAKGGFEILLRSGFARRRGLTLDQRLQYLFTGTNYLLAVSVLVFMVLPSAYLLFGLSPVRVDGLTWAEHYLPFYVLMMTVTALQAGGFRVAAISTSMAAAPTHARSLVAVLLGQRGTWKVTNVSRRADPLEQVIPHILLLALNLVSIGVGLVVMKNVGATVLSVAWASIFVLLLGRVVLEAIWPNNTLGTRRATPVRRLHAVGAAGGASSATATPLDVHGEVARR